MESIWFAFVIWCKTLGSYSSFAEDYNLLGCNTVVFGKQLLTWSIAVPSFSVYPKHNLTSQKKWHIYCLSAVNQGNNNSTKDTHNSTSCMTEHLLWICCIIKSSFWNVTPYSLINKYQYLKQRNLLNLNFSNWWHCWGFRFSEMWCHVNWWVVLNALKVKQSWTAARPITVKAQCSLKMWGTTPPATQCHNPQDLSHMLQSYCHTNLKLHIKHSHILGKMILGYTELTFKFTTFYFSTIRFKFLEIQISLFKCSTFNIQ